MGRDTERKKVSAGFETLETNSQAINEPTRDLSAVTYSIREKVSGCFGVLTQLEAQKK